MKNKNITLNQNINTLMLLKEYKFKKKFLEDKSGYWFEKRMNKYFCYYVCLYTNNFELVSISDEIIIKFKSLQQLIRSVNRFKFEY